MELTELNGLLPKERIEKIKQRTTPLPDANALLKDWDEKRHDIMDPQIRKKRRVKVKDAVLNPDSTIKVPAKYEYREVNRIPLPLEQDIVNIHTAFTMGTEPKLTCETTDKDEQNIFEMLKSILRRNKVKFLNKRVMRAWLAETEVAEYWYKSEDKSWWARLLNKLGVSKGAPTSKLKVAIWSPFNGDKLYPVFDAYGDMILFGREYIVKKDNKEITKFMELDKTNVTIYAYQDGDWVVERTTSAHGFPKLPVIYMWRKESFCMKIRNIRNRLETLLSNFADCLDYNFAPKLVADGAVEDIINQGTGSEIIQLENGAKVAYLTWAQSPDMAKLEFENLTERAYALTNTPRISFENLKGAGSAFSGVSFRFAFMGAHMAVYNHAEVVEEYLQRRVNFLLSAIGAVMPSVKDKAENMEVDIEIVPYIIDNKKDAVELAVSAVEGGVATKRTGIILAGLTDKIEEELKELESEKEPDKTVQ